MNASLQDKIAVVTGGSGAIGSAIIAALEQQGAHAVSLDVARPASGSRLYQVCDVGDDNSVASALATVQRDYGRLDLVVHAAGISREGVLWKLAVEDWDVVQRVAHVSPYSAEARATPVAWSAACRRRWRLMRCGLKRTGLWHSSTGS